MGQRGRFRFSLVRLMGLVAFTAIGLAALLNPSEWWATVMFTLTFAALVLAILGAVFSDGNVRVFAGGFAISGWIYAALVFGPLLNQQVGYGLITGKLISIVYPKLHEIPSDTAAGFKQSSAFTEIGHSLWIWLIAFTGGCVARYLSVRRESRSGATEPKKPDDTS